MKRVFEKTWASCSETGLARKKNEDSILSLVAGDAGLFLVADGIGGRANGEIASSMLRDGFARWWKEEFVQGQDFQSALTQIRDALLHFNREMVRRFGEMNSGTTLALLFLQGTQCAYLSVGDSRVYRWRRFRLQQITKDDVASGPNQGKLTGAVGIRYTLEFSLRTDVVKSGDCFFLCSDGVYRFVTLRFLWRRLFTGTLLVEPEKIVQKISEEVVRNGAGDNYSMIYVRIR